MATATPNIEHDRAMSRATRDGAVIVAKVTFKANGKIVYAVTSKSGKTYAVDADTLHCTCPATVECKHQAIVIERMCSDAATAVAAERAAKVAAVAPVILIARKDCGPRFMR